MVSEARIVLVGATHALDAERVARVLERFRDYTLALEYPQRLEPLIERFAYNGDRSLLRDPYFSHHPFKAEPAFLELLRRSKAPIRCVDVDEAIDADPRGSRQRAIADNIRIIEGPVVAVLGAVHASKVPIMVSGVPVVPVGFYLYGECVSINASTIELPGFDERLA